MAYTTKAISKGGRAGRSAVEGGALALAMSFPKELGGDGDAHNPEQLFAVGWAACFNQAVLVLGRNHGIDPAAAVVGVAVTLHTENNDFKLSAEISLKVPGADKAAVEALINDAHSICPYSKATKGNIPVTLTVL
ncbi:Ohr subfamily peroxiredoxin [Rhizomicrobium palustre]|uniref:Ohr subfamily peroxiredoxin n=1 Tax=Rhizomicrobium palustre TaxID=189966 RepID=A0A846N4Z0_9PROT|nr:Ohr family peroxiredoxin [Rhizomicrobium palustre]NIK90090.1 Ohr subfamily peroxiredoxin [Rhizomicrobium palustre]